MNTCSYYDGKYTCYDMHDCCDCGLRSDGCGCPGCFSCNACDQCYNQD